MASRRAFLIKVWFDIQASYWFIPGCLMLAAIGLARGSILLDTGPDLFGGLLPTTMTDTSLDGARNLLSVIAQSMIGVAGVMFSITMVAVSHASGQFGPRLIGNFMRDRGNQWSLGILIATFVYALMILRSVQSGVVDDVDAFVPQLSLIIAMALALCGVATVIYYVHHVPETINVSNISAALGRRLVARLEATAHDTHPPADGTDWIGAATLCHPGAGYVQRVDMAELETIAKREDLRLHVTAPPGTFVTSGQILAHVSPRPDRDCADALLSCFALGQEQTEDQDLMFLIDQQVEMSARALSPGVNDPHTAMNCLNWLAAGLAAADSHGRYFGVQGCERVRIAALDWTTLLEGSFGACWPYVGDDRMARTHWLALLKGLDDRLQPANRRTLARLLDEAEGKRQDA